MKKLTTALLVTLSITACAGGGGGGTPFDAMGSGTEKAVNVNTGAAFKGIETIVIGGFTVGFDMEKTDSVKAGGGLLGSGFGGKSTARSKLVGVSDATLQAVTNKAYEDFVGKLKAAGYKVVDRSQLTSRESFSTTKSYPVPYEDTQGGMLGGGNTTKYFAPSSFGGLKLFLGDIPGAGGIGFSSPVAGAIEMAEKTGIKVLHVKHHIDFANSDKYGGWHTQSSSISVDQGISMPGGKSQLGIIGGQGGTFSTNIGTIGLSHTISTDKKFAEVSDATSDASRAVEVATNVVGVLGGIGSNTSRRYEFKANSAAFQEASLDTIEKVNGLFVDEMKNLR